SGSGHASAPKQSSPLVDPQTVRAFQAANRRLQAAASQSQPAIATKHWTDIALGFNALILLAFWGLLRSIGRADGRMRALLDSSVDLVTIVDAAGGVRYHSPGIKQMLGFHTEVQVGTPVAHLLHPDDASLMEENFRRIRTGGPVKPIECRWRHADGTVRWLETVSS